LPQIRRLKVSLPLYGFRTNPRGLSSHTRLIRLLRYCKQSEKNSPNGDSFRPAKDTVSDWQMPCGVLCAFVAIFVMGRWGNRPSVELGAFLLILIAGFLILMGGEEGAYEDNGDGDGVLPNEYAPQHNEIVPQKHLAKLLFLGYSYSSEASMANVLNTDTVLHIPPAISPQTAVQAAILQEIRNASPAQA
jgi:hypothetical protein